MLHTGNAKKKKQNFDQQLETLSIPFTSLNIESPKTMNRPKIIATSACGFNTVLRTGLGRATTNCVNAAPQLRDRDKTC